MTKYLDYTGLQQYTEIVKQKFSELSGRGRYLSNWNCKTGLPTTNPGTLPYELKPGDYYIISQLADTKHLEIEQVTGSSLSNLSVDFDTFVNKVDPDEDVDTEYTFLYSVDTWSLDGSDISDISEYGITFEGTPVDTDEIKVTYICAKTNKRPDVEIIDDKPTYNGHASTVVETEEVKVNDTYLFDGTNWILLNNTSREIIVDSELSDTSINPVQNKVITEELNKKSGVHFMYFPEPEEESE